MSTTFEIKIPKTLYNQLHIIHNVQNLPIIEWVCTQLDITTDQIDTHNEECFVFSETEEQVILTVTANNNYLAIMRKYSEIDYVIDEEDFNTILKEVYPIIQFLEARINEELL